MKFTIELLPKKLAWLSTIIVVIVITFLNIRAIQDSPSSTAAIGYVFLPIIWLVAGIPAAFIGYCIGYVIKNFITKKFNWGFGISIFIILISVAWFTNFYFKLNETKSLLSKIQIMNEEHLDKTVDELIAHPKGDYRVFLLAMVLQNHQTSSSTLEKIAHSHDPELYERMGSVFNIMGTNTRGLSVMRLLVQHPNVTPQILTELSSTNNNYVLSDIAKNPKTPEPILRKLFNLNDHFINISLSWNPTIPMDILLKLAESNDTYILIGVTKNPKTPRNILEILSHSQDKLVRIQAEYSLRH